MATKAMATEAISTQVKSGGLATTVVSELVEASAEPTESTAVKDTLLIMLESTEMFRDILLTLSFFALIDFRSKKGESKESVKANFSTTISTESKSNATESKALSKDRDECAIESL